MSTPFILGLFFAHVSSATPCADGQHSADTNATAAKPTPTGQATDDVMKKLSDLVHARKYAPDGATVDGWFIAGLPEDQRLIKPRCFWTNRSRPRRRQTLRRARVATQLAGMEKVDYNALIELARQAQQTTDLEQQTTLLKQFMKDSDLFLQKHPTECCSGSFAPHQRSV